MRSLPTLDPYRILHPKKVKETRFSKEPNVLVDFELDLAFFFNDI